MHYIHIQYYIILYCMTEFSRDKFFDDYIPLSNFLLIYFWGTSSINVTLKPLFSRIGQNPWKRKFCTICPSTFCSLFWKSRTFPSSKGSHHDRFTVHLCRTYLSTCCDFQCSSIFWILHVNEFSYYSIHSWVVKSLPRCVIVKLYSWKPI